MPRRYARVAIALSCSALLACTGCGDSEEAASSGAAGGGGGDVKIGVVLPLSGAYAAGGESSLAGFELAADEINEKGGIESLGGAKIKLVVEDAGEAPGDAARATQRLISANRDLSAITGAWSSALTLTATEIGERAQIPWITRSWSEEITGRGFQYVFRYNPPAGFIGTSSLEEVLALAESEGLTVDSVGMLMETSAVGDSFASGVEAFAKEHGLDVVVNERWTPPLSDATALANKVRAEQPDILFEGYTSVPDGLRLTRKLNEFDIDVPSVVMGGGALSAGFKETMGSLADGIIATSDWYLLDGQDALQQLWEAKTGDSFFPKDAGLSYGMLWTLATAIEDAGSRDPKAVRDALSQVRITSGPAALLYGDVSFDEHGNLASEGHTVVVQWQDGEIKTIWPENYATAEPNLTPAG